MAVANSETPSWMNDQNAVPMIRNARYGLAAAALWVITEYMTARISATEIGRSTEYVTKRIGRVQLLETAHPRRTAAANPMSWRGMTTPIASPAFRLFSRATPCTGARHRREPRRPGHGSPRETSPCLPG